jgi:hypothetical protein
MLNPKETMEQGTRIPIENVLIDNHLLKKPINSIEYLNKVYGENWNDSAIIHPKHSGKNEDFLVKFSWPVDYSCD